MSGGIAQLLQHMRPLRGRALVRRSGPGYHWGEIVFAEGFLAGTHVTFDTVEATFQKGKSHYALVRVSNLKKWNAPQGALPPEDDTG